MMTVDNLLHSIGDKVPAAQAGALREGHQAAPVGQHGPGNTASRHLRPTPHHLVQFQGSWAEVQDQTASHAKAEVLRILSQWQLFGSSFFAVSLKLVTRLSLSCHLS